jgi:bacillithiol biosynthesis cysteine-adding enzyme BshC
MDCRAIPFRQLPHQPKLFVDYLEHFERVANFYAHPPTIKAVERFARKLDFPKARRTEVAAILREQNLSFGAGSATLENLGRLENGAVAVVSGQQVGLFSGPAYAIYKALTAVQIAQELTRAGIEAVPVFWMATEDHDLDEVRHVTWLQDGKLHRFELPADAASIQPVGRIKLGAAVDEPSHAAADCLTGQGGELLAQILRESYRPGETYGSSFAKLFARLFAEQGLILMDPLDAGLHRVAAPVYRQAVEQREELNQKLLERGKELDRAGFAAQVKVGAKSTLLFFMDDGGRQVITASGGKFQASEKTWTAEELEKLAASEPENFSPNALMRPVVQDFLLPTVAYIGGPAEISYFAQSEVVYRHLLGRMPVMLPRSGFTLVDAKATKLLKKYAMKVEEVWAGSQTVRKKMETASVPKNIASTFEKNRKEVSSLLARLGKQLAKLDPTLLEPVQTARKKIEYQLEKLLRKTGRAQDLKTKLIAAHQEYLESILYPHKTLQSRELCLLPFLARWGAGGLGELQKLSTGKKIGNHFIVPLP